KTRRDTHSTMHKNATDPLPALKFATAIDRAAMAATPEARPSRISIMFNAFVTARIQSTDNGIATHTGRYVNLMYVPDFTSTNAARVCPRSFWAGVRTPKSSISPTIKAIVPERSRPSVSVPKSVNVRTDIQLDDTLFALSAHTLPQFRGAYELEHGGCHAVNIVRLEQVTRLAINYRLPCAANACSHNG